MQSMPSNKDMMQEIEALRRNIRRLERDNRLLVTMNENAERLRRFNQQEKELQNLFNTLLLENCPNMIFLFTEELRLVNCSHVCLPVLKNSDRDEVKNFPFESVFSDDMKPAWLEKVYKQNKEVLRSRKSCRYDDTIEFLSGEYMHVQVAISPIVDSDDECKGTVMAINDITELTRTKQHAVEASLSKSSFLANMSHEIRTPMNAIKGLSELLMLTELSGVQLNYVQSIVSSSNSLLNIINDILDFSKIDANKVELITGTYDVEELVAEISNAVSLRAMDKNLMLFIEAMPTLPKALMGDDVRIKQIITNILSNAVKYTAEGYVRLELNGEWVNDKFYLVCRVSDTGIGIRDEDFPQLFEAFTRLDLHTNRSIVGTGLGLAITKQLIEAMGGVIAVDSVYGEGSVFTVRIPQEVIDPRPLAEVEDAASKRILILDKNCAIGCSKTSLIEALKVPYELVTKAEDIAALDMTKFTHCLHDQTFEESIMDGLRAKAHDCQFIVLKDMRFAMKKSHERDMVLFIPMLVSELARALNKDGDLSYSSRNIAKTMGDISVVDASFLVVDDNEINLMVGGEILRSFGANVLCAHSGKQALEMCAAQRFDIVFMDHMMPGMDGIEATGHIRQQEGPNKYTPVVALTANVVNGMREYYLEQGMDDFIGKPIDIDEISRVLSKWMPASKLRGIAFERIFASDNDEIDRIVFGKDQDCEARMNNLISAMDEFGLYASDVLSEVGGDYGEYINRMDRTAKELPAMTKALRSQIENDQWDEFSDTMYSVSKLIYDVGARDCASHARQMSRAAKEKNIEYVLGDFESLMGNVYMLEKKMEVAVPMVCGGEAENFNDSDYMLKILKDMQAALQTKNIEKSMELMGDIAGHSLNKEIDTALGEIKEKIEQRDFFSAARNHANLLHNFATILSAAGRD